MRERVRLSWQLGAHTSVGVTANWLLQQKLKDHILEAMSAFWYPFALQSQLQDEPADIAVPALTTQAEALLAIARLERQIALIRQTFLEEVALPSVSPRDALRPDSEVPATAASPASVPASPSAVIGSDGLSPSLLLSEHGNLAIRGFESFDQSLASDAHA